GCAPGRAGAADDHPPGDRLADLDGDLREMGEARDDAVAMVDVDHVAVAAVVAGLDVDHCARRGRRYRLTERGTEVDPGVQRRRAEVGIESRAATAGDRRCG